ncbi:MAG: DUF202 domain-containing protein [Streptomyces sp.]|uniref:DUF202 domain-containing protein n=1 Tax=Streptomyces sp. TaxID=1931 RepID=UPI003D6A5067
MTGQDAADPRDPDARDPAAQPERTRLAWRRTTLTFAVAVGLSVRQMLYDGTSRSVVAVAAGVLAWLAFLAVAHRRIAGMTANRPEGIGPGSVGAAALCTLAMVAVGVMTLW